MLRTGYHLHRSPPRTGGPLGPLPQLSAEADHDSDAFDSWLAHVDARRAVAR
jgi:hypothetical protein